MANELQCGMCGEESGHEPQCEEVKGDTEREAATTNKRDWCKEVESFETDSGKPTWKQMLGEEIIKYDMRRECKHTGNGVWGRIFRGAQKYITTTDGGPHD